MNLSSAQLIKMFQDIWNHPDSDLISDRSLPIANSDEDQKGTTDNPLWEIMRWVPANEWKGKYSPDYSEVLMLSLKSDTIILPSRRELVRQYSYPIVSPGDLKWMSDLLGGSSLVDIGAGNGYWAWQMRQMGTQVFAYDPHVPGDQNGYCGGKQFTDVAVGDASYASKHPESTLLVSWPPPDDSMAHDALKAYQGERFIYCGETNPSVSGDDDFYETLEKEWKVIDRSSSHINWHGIHSCFIAYSRK